jgi:hypothetical protein
VSRMAESQLRIFAVNTYVTKMALPYRGMKPTMQTTPFGGAGSTVKKRAPHDSLMPKQRWFVGS